ncbi:MAG: alpha/beta hydrolase [Prevotella sp.]|jgi:acetyl esterase/lipase|nr:alpha/beta hydrolase [Prevotella sp.]MCH4181576.1 alpha/beta hydrolase [Prevotella sp.]MCH4212137.1 alpha/beta hydrolase [Prevotella sp.]MCH4241147.1 alpha/beta hydrolase [Prevotella sp.]
MEDVIQIDLYGQNGKVKSLGNEKQSVLSNMQDAPEGSLFFFPAKLSSSITVIQCPGGGFNQINLSYEGLDFAPWFNEKGVNFAVLKYRYPRGKSKVLLEDITCAMDFLREQYPEKCVKLGVMGTSIGGYYAAISAQLPEGKRNDFEILLYSVTTMQDELTHKHCQECILGGDHELDHLRALSPLEHVTPSTSPAFIVASADDPAVSPLNSILYAAELEKNHVPFALHIYENGGHGFGFKDTYPHKQEYLSELEAWLKKQ